MPDRQVQLRYVAAVRFVRYWQQRPHLLAAALRAARRS